jgi:hypothetical protein
MRVELSARRACSQQNGTQSDGAPYCAYSIAQVLTGFLNWPSSKRGSRNRSIHREIIRYADDHEQSARAGTWDLVR